jgi:uncharacterized beta-barrel protein YwiB (DUF1934 family)
MTKDVLVTISGLQFSPDTGETPEPVEVTCPGTYYQKNGKHYVMYEEIMEGFSGVTKNTLKLQPGSLDIVKRGISNVHMVFEKNKKNMTCYNMPFGSLMLGIDARGVTLEETEDHIHARVSYELEMNYEKMADCEISIDIRSKEAGNFSFEIDKRG